jgi:hypothetical protein
VKQFVEKKQVNERSANESVIEQQLVFLEEERMIEEETILD